MGRSCFLFFLLRRLRRDLVLRGYWSFLYQRFPVSPSRPRDVKRIVRAEGFDRRVQNVQNQRAAGHPSRSSMMVHFGGLGCGGHRLIKLESNQIS